MISRVGLKAGAAAAMDTATKVNVYLNATEPWKLVKDDCDRAGAVLWTAVQANFRAKGGILAVSSVHDPPVRRDAGSEFGDDFIDPA